MLPSPFLPKSSRCCGGPSNSLFETCRRRSCPTTRGVPEVGVVLHTGEVTRRSRRRRSTPRLTSGEQDASGRKGRVTNPHPGIESALHALPAIRSRNHYVWGHRTLFRDGSEEPMTTSPAWPSSAIHSEGRPTDRPRTPSGGASPGSRGCSAGARSPRPAHVAGGGRKQQIAAFVAPHLLRPLGFKRDPHDLKDRHVRQIPEFLPERRPHRDPGCERRLARARQVLLPERDTGRRDVDGELACSGGRHLPPVEGEV